MAKLTLNTIGSRYGSIDALNDNFDAIETAFENTFSRDGTGPNTLEATLDANSQRIINLPDPVGNTEPATKGWVIAQPGQAAASAVAAAASAAAAAVSEANAEESASIIADWEWKEEWATGVVYAVNNIVAIPSGTYEGWSFICVIGHTASAAFDTDFSAGKWDVLAKRGSAGAGTGDMLAANNLSDLTNVSAARTNLGVASATGSGASGTWDISITGNAATATNATTAAACSGNSATATALTTASGSAPSYSARAWVNFNGTGTVAIRASGNVSSITDNNTGLYTINFTTALPDANYAVISGSNGFYNYDGGVEMLRVNGAGTNWAGANVMTTTQVQVHFGKNATFGADPAIAMVAVFR